MRFKLFIESEEQKDILQTLAKLPIQHRNLVKGFDWRLEGGNTLKGDSQHVGYMDDHDKEIAVAAPWSYSRSFCALHEIAHQVFEHLPPELKHQWDALIQKTKHEQIAKNPENKDALNQSSEEIFCHSYACYYSKHKVLTYYHPAWMKFIEQLP